MGFHKVLKPKPSVEFVQVWVNESTNVGTSFPAQTILNNGELADAIGGFIMFRPDAGGKFTMMSPIMITSGKRVRMEYNLHGGNTRYRSVIFNTNGVQFYAGNNKGVEDDSCMQPREIWKIVRVNQ